MVKLGFGDVDFNKVAEQERALEEAEKRKARAQKEAKRKAANEQTQKPIPQPQHRPAPTTQDSSNSLIDFSEPEPAAAPKSNSELSGLSLTPSGTQEGLSPNFDASASILSNEPFPDSSKSIPNSTTLLPDSHDHSNTENSAVRLKKNGTDVAVTEVLILEGCDTTKDNSTGDEHQDDFDDYDYDAEEVSSEFGELSMVEPLPMDDNDYGLM
jgi:hypothetical protein